MLELLWFCFLCSALLQFWDLPLTNTTIYFRPPSQGNLLYLPLSEIHYLPGCPELHFFTHETQNWICKTGIHQAEEIYMVLLSVSGSNIWWIRNVASFRLMLYISLWLKSLFPLLSEISLSKGDSSRNYQVPLYLSTSSHVLHTEESHSRYC